MEKFFLGSAFVLLIYTRTCNKNMEPTIQATGLKEMYAAYLEDVTPGGFGSGGHGFTPWFETEKEVQSHVDDLKAELACYNEDDDDDDDTLCVQWIGSLAELFDDTDEQAQIVRLRFYEELEP